MSCEFSRRTFSAFLEGRRVVRIRRLGRSCDAIRKSLRWRRRVDFIQRQPPNAPKPVLLTDRAADHAQMLRSLEVFYTPGMPFRWWSERLCSLIGFSNRAILKVVACSAKANHMWCGGGHNFMLSWRG